MAGAEAERIPCQDLPGLLSSFVDTFVDFSVSGLFLPPNPNPNPPPPLQTTYSSPDRLVAVGDLHGDLQKSKQALRLAGLIDTTDRWIGGSTTVVQVGDVLDRGGEEIKILYFLEKLKREAAKAGGTIVTMNGNHEIMNVDGDFRSPELRELYLPCGRDIKHKGFSSEWEETMSIGRFVNNNDVY